MHPKNAEDIYVRTCMCIICQASALNQFILRLLLSVPVQEGASCLAERDGREGGICLFQPRVVTQVSRMVVKLDPKQHTLNFVLLILAISVEQ